MVGDSSFFWQDMPNAWLGYRLVLQHQIDVFRGWGAARPQQLRALIVRSDSVEAGQCSYLLLLENTCRFPVIKLPFLDTD